MKPKGLLIAVVLLAVLGGLVWWSNRDEAAKTKTAADTAVIKLLTIPEDQIVEIRIKKLTGEVLNLKREGVKWRITAPTPLPADLEAAAGMVSTLSAVNADKVIDEKATDLKSYGLAIPTLDVEIVRKDGKTSRLLIGDDTLNGSGAYAKLGSDAKVVTVLSTTKTTLDKSPGDLRDKHILSFDPDKLSRIELAAKGPAIEFGKSGPSEWQIVKPRVLRADGSAVDGLITKLKDAKMDLTAEDTAKQFASATKLATVSVTDAAGVQTLEVRRDKENNLFAKSSAVDGIYKIDSVLADSIGRSLDEFRNRKLFDFGFSDPSMVQVQGVDYSKAGDKWTAKGKFMDNTSVQTMIDKLRDLAASKFAEKGGGQPVFTAHIISNKGKRNEKVVITKQDDRYFAQREGEPSVYELDTKTYDDLQAAVSGVKEAAPPAPAKKK